MGHSTTRAAESEDSKSLFERANINIFSLCLVPGLGNPGYLTLNPSYNLASSGFQKLTITDAEHWAVSLEQVTTTLPDEAEGVPPGTQIHSCAGAASPEQL